MSRSACPTPEELSRQVSLGPDESFSAHIEGCESCAKTFSAESSLVGMFQSLSFSEPSATQVSNVRQALLEKTAPSAPVLKLVPPVGKARPQRVLVILAAAAAIALVVGASWWLSASSSSAPTLNKKELTLAQVQSSEGTTYDIAGSTADEIVRLQNGTVTVQVQHLAPGQRFRVITGDAEVEVRGTRFDVTAKDDKLVKVLVHEGKVEVRAAQSSPALLLPNQAWDVAEQTPTSSASTQATTLSIKEPSTKEGPKNKTSEPKQKDNAKLAEGAFTKGVEQMTAKDFGGAAESFAQVTTLAPNSALAEDARYFYAFALFRGEQKAKAKSAFISFMAKYPNASRRGEAAVALGQLYLESGELDEAQIMFESASDDPSDNVKKSAAAGLSTIAKKRKTPPN